MKFKLLFSFLISSSLLIAQNSKSVQLLNKQNGLPIEFSSIINNNSKKGTSSNNKGIFKITGNPNDVINISYIGYKSTSILFKKLADIIYLHPLSVQLQGVEISSTRKKYVELNKLQLKNLDAPLTTNSVSSKLIKIRNTNDLGTAVKSATGVRPINRYGGFQTFRIRGFNNFVLLNDGTRDERHNLSTSAPSTNLANVERIEILKGPSGVMFGHAALGGIINIIRKKPTTAFSAEFNTTYGSFNTYEMSVGMGGPINQKLRYRVDFGVSKSDGWRDFGINTNNASFAVNYTPTKKDVLDISFQANNDKYDTDTGIPVDKDGSIVKAMDVKTRYNDPQDYLKHKRFDLQIKYKHQFNNKLKLTNNFSWSDDDINYLSTEWLSFNAAKDSITRGFPFYFNHTTNTIQNQLDVSYQFKTGKIKHKSLFGQSVSILERKSFRGSVVGPGTYTTISVQNPILNQGHIEAVDQKVQVRDEFNSGFYWQNWSNISDNFKALIGIRYDIFKGRYATDKIKADRTLIKAGDRTEIPSTAFSYRAGLVYQPLKNLSIFSSYSNYFKPSRTIAPNSEIFDPEKGYQIEGGLKFERNNTLNISLSTFYILKHNIVEKNKVNQYLQIGEADSKGIEFDLEYTPIKNVYLKAGYAFTEAKISAYGAANSQVKKAGNALPFTPKHLANLWVNYELEDGLGFGVGGNYTSDNYTNSDNSYTLPAYLLLDGAIYYQKNNIRIGVNINNITNKLYFTDAIYDYQFFPGAERNFKINLSYKI
ncbi:TonB-dependent receptor [Tenacibaculum dicentrarchi]|nr:TonB-dependent receptor [Tenacibaculum dicentrarchi]MCD8424758.1 TonB-dependent receptor [Tenacibaculum dicentrarchi]MCD8434651.1 TonB-dependent receptor [Tenacibaculum dicentrarchi]MCD8442284.1 TonB-dependent receptor [Tenacibaculum dicentrarchi]MDB0615625.1 TonB-dependent siderophore receptor [Tenacibaculum dicentrarchi]